MMHFELPDIEDATSALEFAEKTRDALISIQQTVEDAISGGEFGRRITAGLMMDAHASREAAQAVAKDLSRLLVVIHSATERAAPAARLFGDKLQALYVEPIVEAQNRSSRRDGLQVNGV
jgi:fermentation-respiration switch protein FrsA (DUF1100 family)